MEDFHFRGERRKQGQSPSPLLRGCSQTWVRGSPSHLGHFSSSDCLKTSPTSGKMPPWVMTWGTWVSVIHTPRCRNTKPQRDLRNWWKWGVKSGVKVRLEPRVLFGGWILVIDLLNKQEPLEVTFFPIDKEVYIQVFISAFLSILKMSNSIIKHVKLKG